MIIGQSSIRDIFIQLALHKNFPSFTLLVGPAGSGKTTLAKNIASLLDSFVIELEDVKIDSIREMIKNAYTVNEPTVYIISDADEMSVGAKNALLKVCEEPPKNVHIIMTLTSKSNTLETITSRAQTFIMQPYSKEELVEYADTLNTSVQVNDLVIQLAQNPGDVRYLLSVGVDELYTYAQKVVDNIAEVSGANAFKIASKVAIKAGDEGYDMEMFFRVFQHICLDLMHERDKDDRQDLLDAISITNKHLLNLGIKGVNRQFVIDSWILEIRRAWM